MNPILDWNRDELLQSLPFAPLYPIISTLKAGGFPSLDELNSLLVDRNIAVQRGCGLRFVAQGVGRLAFEAQYEPRCYLTGEVQTRTDNWHDLLNALVWLTFPKSKAAINARHYAALTSANVPELRGRGAVRDTNTLLDESGVIVVYADDELADLLRNFSWHELFWNRREQVRSGMGFYLFGHGLYEKARRPYVGMTGQGLLLAVDAKFFTWQTGDQLAYLDSRVAEYLDDVGNCCCTRELSPVPLLGVPDWAADNDKACYYENTDYFRPGRRVVCSE